MSAALRLLLIEDSQDDADLIVHALTRGGFTVDARRVALRETLVSALDSGTWDLAIADCSMPGFSGPAALKVVSDRAPEVPFIFVSGTLDEEVAAAAMKKGACDYVVKGNLTRLVPAVQRELGHAAARREHRRAEQRLAHLAFHDALTGLPNRVLFRDTLKNAMNVARRDGTSVTLLVMDLDGFKDINDTLGHQCGDRVLKEVGHRLRRQVRDADTVARLGGDEFGIVLSRSSIGDAASIARVLVEEISRPVVIGHQMLSIRASVGIAQFPKHASTLELLSQRADLAMYAAKIEASGMAVYDQTRDRRTRLPVDELKIDRSFVADLAVGNEVIVRSTIDLAHNLGLTVVGEGVDSPVILERLRVLGCDAAQGTLLSKPLPADALVAWVRQFAEAWQMEEGST